ncbi:DNA-binding protein [Burkholderia pyrrocinia]|uniref:DNA-binding protein n=1 Tax=Burkholderia pyrrocinia TaxID=60550 RepID=UPI00158D2362|nr:DNA-binding protein [Burkholderia pyrrocinia]
MAIAQHLDTGSRDLLTTEEFAAAQKCAPQTVRKNYCLYGHYHGAQPIKHPSGRLLWHASDSAMLLSGVRKADAKTTDKGADDER